MASGHTIFELRPQGSIPTASDYATPDTIEDTSTPPSLTPVLDFDAGATHEHAEWRFIVPSTYDGGGFTWKWKGGTDNTSVGTFALELRIKPIADTTILTGDLGIDTQTESEIQDTPPATPQNKLNYSTTGTLSHANAGSPSQGDEVIARLTRDTTTDTNTGDLQLASAEIQET